MGPGVTPISIDLPDALPTLALAVVAASDTPVLLLNGDMVILAASDSFCAAFGADAAALAGTLIYDLDDHGWNQPRLRSLLNATVSGRAAVERYEINLTLPRIGARRLVLRAQKLRYGTDDEQRLLLAIADVTEARLGAEVAAGLLHDQTVLLNEVQHRVANSLQIIASILMQSARKVQSEEARGHLTDAHQRVMSIATLQRHLATAQTDQIEVGPYLNQLCESISASMIYDHAQLSLTTRIDNQLVAADVSVSLGLVVTELIINALKHAFPEKRKGTVVVDYSAQGADWILSVSDDGIGMPDEAKPGLGSSIVQALAKQLHADIDVTNAWPGTRVSLVHGRKASAQAANDAVEQVAA